MYLVDFASLPFWDGPLFDSVVYLRQAAAVVDGRHGDASLLAMSPLYGYFVAALGANARLVAVAQAALGIVSIGLAGLFGERLARGRGWIAAAAVATYGMFTFYESKLMSDVLGMTLLLGSLVTLVSAEERASPERGVTSGALLGLAALARASLVPCLPLVVASSFFVPRTDRRRFGGLLASGLVVVLVAHGALTYSAVGRFVPVILPSKTFATMSTHSWDGRLRASGGGDAPPSAWDVVEQAEAQLDLPRAAPSPRIDWLGLLRGAPAKLWRAFSNTERGFDYPYYGERELLASFRLLPGSFGALLTFGVVGAVVGRRRWRAMLPLAAVAAGTVGTIALTHPSSRYRIPFALALALVAPLAIDGFATSSGPRRSAIGAILLVGVSVSTGDFLTHQRTNPASLERVLATSYAASGDRQAAEEHFRRAERIDAAFSQ